MADDITELLAPYLQARDAHQVGEVTVRALGDPSRPTAPPIPYQGVSVLLFPYSVPFDSEIDDVKAHFRDSLRNYMGAVADVVAARTGYESALVWGGGGELVRGEVSDAQGLARLTEIPGGEWVLLAWREESHPGKAPLLKGRETKGFRDIPLSTGYSVVTYWWMRLQVRAGETTALELNDRNVWMAGIREDLIYMQGLPATKIGPRRRGY
ncbi:MAG TPA: hypothetical protein VMS64_10170 [Candidatus Methylomirabilis sp.]|nr:hypothetical protein [Candidatus Methylomirabilis sp.]